MSKHNQSAALGKLSDFASTPVTTEDRLDRIEMRLESIEKVLNTLLYTLSDLNETFDKVSKQPQVKQDRHRSSQHHHRCENPVPKTENTNDPPVPLKDLIGTCKKVCTPLILDFLSDGKTFHFTSNALREELKIDGFSKSQINQSITSSIADLVKSGQIIRTTKKIDGKPSHFIRKSDEEEL